jgi:nicotinamide riboside transporter PnuC
MTHASTESDASRGRYFAWRNSHPHEAEDPSAVWAAAWKAGSWDAIRRNADLGLMLTQIVQRLEELAHLYVDVEREVERSSAYWHTEEDAP